MVENRFNWFGHVKRRPIDFVVRTVDQMKNTQIIKANEDLKNYQRNYYKIFVNQ